MEQSLSNLGESVCFSVDNHLKRNDENGGEYRRMSDVKRKGRFPGSKILIVRFIDETKIKIKLKGVMENRSWCLF